ncbi:hypothetical protein [Brevibacterium luteolum]|uniref:hypothetical protein n=1 Tax=Brevibacterium luteolum TaxID=199591 RepID=UPI00288316E5|nr:hypothetical protein [Brevibacterium luteolum]
MSAGLTSPDASGTGAPAFCHDAEVAAVFDEVVLLDELAEEALSELLDEEAEASEDEADEDPESSPAEPAEPLLADPLPAVAPWSLR